MTDIYDRNGSCGAQQAAPSRSPPRLQSPGEKAIRP
jgi:hypothetical protein